MGKKLFWTLFQIGLFGLFTYQAWISNSLLGLYLVANIVLHEIGHYCVVRFYGWEGKFVFFYIGAGVVPKFPERIDSIKMFYLAFAGPAVNTLIGLGAMLLGAQDPRWIYFPLILSAFNSGAFFITDGHKMLNALVDSVVSKGGKFLVGVLVALFLVANTVLLSSMGSLYVMLAIQAVCFWIALRPDDNLDPSGLRACIVPIILMYALLAGNFALAVAMAR